MIDLLPCPFCGFAPEGTSYPCHGVTAVNCSNRTCIAYCRQVSVEQWNTRTYAPKPTDDLVHLRDKYKKLRDFVDRARQESDLISIQSHRDGLIHKIQVPYWFMRDPE